MVLAGCTHVPPLPAPQIIYVGCPAVTSCPIPASAPVTNGDLSSDVRNLEAELVSCGLQVEAVKQCQEEHRVKTRPAEKSIN
ncbi:Rz1-like lysis system protein LysC [Rahnella bonaserana]|uniref:Rz1-like lysis system protein LysC n=1 Tax=Rahnella bonaserana TaxID=2816248 RepID=UPI0024C33208|nr:Rz1-like lysis system protein LysC [Rahnella bonaserana]WHZ42871.1 Rz1-like lysis system protein LysC [Rahnella bonaserana]